MFRKFMYSLNHKACIRVLGFQFRSCFYNISYNLRLLRKNTNMHIFVNFIYSFADNRHQATQSDIS